MSPTRLREGPRLSLLLLLLIAACTFALYAQFLRNPVVFDDNNFFGARVHPEYFTWQGLLQPRGLAMASFEWTRVLLGLQIGWYRLGNLLLHIGNSLLLFVFLRRLFACVLWERREESPAVAPLQVSGSVLAFFGALFFALHPVAVYGTAYLIQRTSVMANLFALVMMLLVLEGVVRRNRGLMTLSALAYLCAVFSKEHVIMVPAVAGALVLLLRRPDRALVRLVTPAFFLYAVIGLWVFWQIRSGGTLATAYEPRAKDMLGALAARIPGFDPTLAWPLSIVTQCGLFFKYLLLWIVPDPAWMSVDMFETFVPRLASWHVLNVFAFLLYPVVCLALLLRRGRIGLLGFGLLGPWLMFATELSTVRIQEMFVLYRSYLWMPWLFAALPALCGWMAPRRALLVLLAAAVALMPLSMNRLITFSSPLLLWDDAARLAAGKDDHPGVERVYHNRGLALLKAGDAARGLLDLDHSLRLNDRQPLVHNDRGVALEILGRKDEARRDFDSALRLAPGFIKPLRNRARLLRELGDAAGAERDYAELCRRNVPEGCMNIPRATLEAIARAPSDARKLP